MTTRNLAPIRDHRALATFLAGLLEQIPPHDDVGLAMLYRSELVMLAVALDTHAAEVDIKAKRAWADLQDEPEIVRTVDPAIPWVDPRQPGADPIVGFEPWLDGRAMQRVAEIETARRHLGRRKDGVGVIRLDDPVIRMTEHELLAGLEGLGLTVPAPSSSAPPRPSCSPGFGIAGSTPGKDSDTG